MMTGLSRYVVSYFKSAVTSNDARFLHLVHTLNHRKHIILNEKKNASNDSKTINSTPSVIQELV